jgi:transcriptional regulator with XRE-family HTH domain
MGDIGLGIKIYREKAGLGQFELAAAINQLMGTSLKRNTISNYEKGVSRPSKEIINAIAKALGVTSENIIEPLLSFTGNLDNRELFANVEKHFVSSYTKSFFEAILEVYDLILDPIYSGLDQKGVSKKKNLLLKGFKDHDLVRKQIARQVINDEIIGTIIDNYLKRK